MQETITLNTQEQKRVMVLNQIRSGQLSAAQAASLLNLSVRQVQRTLAAYEKEGVAALAHGNRNRKPVHTINDQVRQQVIKLATTTYRDCNQQHLRDLLEEREGIVLSRASVHRILQQAGVLAPAKQRPPQQRRRRPRYPQAGQLVQSDGSKHLWLQERAGYLTWLAAIDDATSQVVAALFREQEDAAGYMALIEQLVQRHGRPLALYHDRHGIFQVNQTALQAESIPDQLEGTQARTQFGRVMQQLDITSIAARSPQANGRVERLFRTLQDRLVIELRLADARTCEQANAVLQSYLPKFNTQFAVPATQEETAYRPVEAGMVLHEVVCFHDERLVGLDNTVQFGTRRLQINASPKRKSYARATVQVHERLDGTLAVLYAGEQIAWQEAPLEARPLRARSRKPSRGALAGSQLGAEEGAAPSMLPHLAMEAAAPSSAVQKSPPSKPKATHPWRHTMVSKTTQSVNT